MTGRTLRRLQELAEGYSKADVSKASDERGESGVRAVRVP